VLKAADGEILDGCHRLNSDPSWKSMVLENIDTPEKKIIARLVANFHRRTVLNEEKAEWINQLAEIYRNNGLKVEAETNAEKASLFKPNEIVKKISEVTGLCRRTVRMYLEPHFKQDVHRNLDPKQHPHYKDPEEVILTALSYRRPQYAREVIERFKEKHEKELLESPIFRKKILDKINGKPKALSLVIPNSASRDRQIQELLNLNENYGLPEKMPGANWETTAEKKARLQKEKKAHIGYEPLPDYFETFKEECPNCMCSKCDHADTCIERVRKEESPSISVAFSTRFV